LVDVITPSNVTNIENPLLRYQMDATHIIGLDAGLWCGNNLKGFWAIGWTFHRPPLFVAKFELQEDAALFKLFFG
jgi:hypothetical protein